LPGAPSGEKRKEGMAMRKWSILAIGLMVLATAVAFADTVKIEYKAALSLDVKLQAGAPFTVGDKIVIAYFVTNTGEVTLHDVKVTDSLLGDIKLDKATIAPGESAEGGAAYIVKEADVCGLTSTVVASALDPCGKEVTDSKDVVFDIQYKAGLKITKEVNKTEVLPGEPIIYTYTAENIGNVTLTDVAVTDSLLGDVPLDVTILAPGEKAKGSLSYVPTEDEICSVITNKATATAVDPCGKKVTVETEGELAVKVISPPPGITLQCFTDKTEAMVGEEVMYTFVIINNGQTILKDIALKDSLLGSIALPKTELAPGEEMKVEATYTITEADACGELTNKATVTASAPCGKLVSAECSASVKPLYIAKLSLTKKADKEIAKIGDTITYTYTVTNVGNVTLTKVTVADAELGPVPLGEKGLPEIAELAPGASVSGQLTSIVTEKDICAPKANKATASALDPCGNEVKAEASLEVPVSYTARLELEFWPDKTSVHLGDTVIFTYKVRNAGDVTLTDVIVTDKRLGKVLTVATLAPYEWAQESVPYQVTEADLAECKPLEIEAVATAKDLCGNPVGPVEGFQAPIARLAVDKSTDFSGPANVGDVITYHFTVTNIGGTPLKDVEGMDSLLGKFVVKADLLMPGEVATGEATYTVTPFDATGLPIVNVHSVTAVDLWGNPVGPVEVKCTIPTAISSLKQEWFFKGRHLAMFINNTNQTVQGFRIIFDQPVTEVKQLCFGGMAPVIGEANEDKTEFTFMGEIKPNATFVIEWLPPEVKVVALVWIVKSAE